MIRRHFDAAALSGPSLRAFGAIAGRWSLTKDEQMCLLGIGDVATLERWRSGAEVCLELETLTRISLALGIYAAINVLLPVTASADAWMRAPNQAPIFGGRSALDRMLDGGLDDLFAVRRYLDAQAYN